MKERLQKLISASGLASRRAAEELILSGRVLINGEKAALGDCADPELDTVTVDGKPLCRKTKFTYIMLNKPRGYVTTLSDEKGRACISDLIRDVDARVYPVGRLDMYSEGLLLLTDDGELANRLMHPSSETVKTYLAWIRGECTKEQLEQMSSPMCIDGYTIKPAGISVERRTKDGLVLSVSIHEGRNRQIRKMCELCGLKLTRLRRISEGAILLGELPSGKWRYLTEEELQGLGCETTKKF